MLSDEKETNCDRPRASRTCEGREIAIPHMNDDANNPLVAFRKSVVEGEHLRGRDVHSSFHRAGEAHHVTPQVYGEGASDALAVRPVDSQRGAEVFGDFHGAREARLERFGFVVVEPREIDTANSIDIGILGWILRWG